MQSFRDEVADPLPTPGVFPEVAPRPIEPPVETPPTRSRKWLVALAIVLVVCAVLGFVIHKRTASRTHSAAISPVPNRNGQGLRLKGTTEATQSRAILAPMLSGQQVGILTIRNCYLREPTSGGATCWSSLIAKRKFAMLSTNRPNTTSSSTRFRRNKLRKAQPAPRMRPNCSRPRVT